MLQTGGHILIGIIHSDLKNLLNNVKILACLDFSPHCILPRMKTLRLLSKHYEKDFSITCLSQLFVNKKLIKN